MRFSEAVSDPAPIKKVESWKMFNRISTSYDFLNHLFSFGLDVYWRKHLIRYLSAGKNQLVLDLATGTADALITLAQDNPKVKIAYGLDLAEQMLNVGRQKINSQGLEQKIFLQHGDAHQIPFGTDHFDAVTIAFGIRNMTEYKQVLTQMLRVLKPNGRALILEFSLPENAFLRSVYLFYLRRVIPLVGGWFSGDKEAYRYLNKTVEDFPYGQNFCRAMESVGFKNVQAFPLTLGIATLYKAEKVAL